MQPSGWKASARVALVSFLSACSTATVAPREPSPSSAPSSGSACPIHGGTPADQLIQAGETRFAHLWQLTRGGNNAEGYFSFEGDQISFQRTNPEEGIDCDQIFVLGGAHGTPERISSGKGVTTCSYFYPGARAVLFASTHATMESCPPPLDHSEGYAWAIRPEFDLWVRDLETVSLRRLTEVWGYDAECTISPRGDRIVFTSTRSGDLELWTCALDGSDLRQVTATPGYDGGAFFSHDGTKLVFRSTAFDPEKGAEQEALYREHLAQWKVRPHELEIHVADADGANRRQVTHLGGANFAPFFFPDDSRIIFASSHHEASARNFDLFAIGVDGQGLERITTYEGFDAFPMFSPDGRYLVFASNRGGTQSGETNLFVAAWRP